MSRRPKKNLPPENGDLRRQEMSISGADDRRNDVGGISRGDGSTSTQDPRTENPYAVLAVSGFPLLAVLIVFGQTLRHDFVNYDDRLYVYENPYVTHGLTTQGIVWAFTSKHASNWHPLTWLSHMLDCQLFGLAPWGPHLVNVLLHAATAILLFLVLRRMTGDLWPSVFVAAVFAVHPLRVESVAWVAERKDVLSGLFFMLTLWAYVGYVRHPFSTARYLRVMLFFALGLMAKPMLVTLPFVLLLLDYWPLGRMTPLAAENRNNRWGGSCTATPGATVQLSPQRIFSIPPQRIFSFSMRLAMEKVPLLVLAAASCAATLWAQSEAIAVNEHIPLSLRMGNAVISYVAYLVQLVYPAGLAVLYPFPESDLPMWKVAGALLLLAAICGGVVALWRRCPYLLVGWLWYLGMLLPVIGLVQVGLQAMADRYTYLTQIGLCIAFAWGVAQFTQSWPYRGWVCGIASALVVATLLGCAWQQTSYWRDNQTLWTHTLACTSKNYVAHNNLGLAIADVNRLQEAIEHFQQAIRFNPKYPEAHNNLGFALLLTGQFQTAIKHCEQAVQLKPDFPEAYNNLGIALLQAGQAEEAMKNFKQALYLKPDYINACNNLALAYANMHRSSEAIATAQKAWDLAHSQGQAALAKQIEDWLTSYRVKLSNLPKTPP